MPAAKKKSTKTSAPAAPAAARRAKVRTPADRLEEKAQAELTGRVLGFFDANKRRKALEREETGHKEFFKELAGEARPWSVEAEGVVVTVTEESSERLDLDELRRVVTPEIIAACTKPSTCTKVTVRERKDEAAA